MSASITLSGLSWSVPDGRSLFRNLELGFGAERTGLVGRNGVGKTTLLKLISGALKPQSGKVTVHGTIGILQQRDHVGSDETVARLFGVGEAIDLLRKAERGDASVEDLQETDWSLEGRILSALSRARLDVRPETPLAELSGGQRMRACIAAVIFAEPDFLLLDEPTNNLDREGREALISFLSKWRAGAIVVSHDRELLDTMEAIVELTTLGATRYGGNWSQYRERKALELAAVQHDLAEASKRVTDAARSAEQTAERKARKDGAGERKGARGCTPRIALGLLKDGSEDTSGQNARLAERRRQQAQDAANAARERIEILQPFSVVLPSTGLPSGKIVLDIDRVCAGYDPARPVIQDFSLSITGPERIAITGPNGSGKTTLLSLITGSLQPWTGSIRRMTSFAVLDQQVAILDRTLSIRDNFARINPGADENACRSTLARFMFRADAALQIVGHLSGGQLLRAGLACVLGGPHPPPLLILDEPTNHLDIHSIEAIEAGLRAYDGALIIVSHDEPFLQAINLTRRVELRV